MRAATEQGWGIMAELRFSQQGGLLGKQNGSLKGAGASADGQLTLAAWRCRIVVWFQASSQSAPDCIRVSK